MARKQLRTLHDKASLRFQGGGRLSSFEDDQRSAGCLTKARRQVQGWQVL